MATENTLRTRQNMEVLDVWKNLHSQVNALTKKQIAVFPDTLKPKTQRDLEVEVNVDKSVETLNNLLESHLANLEFVLRNDQELRSAPAPSAEVAPAPRRPVVEDDDYEDIKMPEIIPTESAMTKEERRRIDQLNKEAIAKYKEKLAQAEKEKLETKAKFAEERRKEQEKAIAQQKDVIKSVGKSVPFQNAYQDVISTGSVVSQWNNIVRYYQKQGLSRQSQEMVKTRVQDLTPNLEAILYGLGQAVDVLFSSTKFDNTIGLKILEFLRTQSIYQVIKTQIDTASFEIVSVSAMDTAFRNIFSSLSEERRVLLDEVSARGDISSTPIRKIPKFSSDNFQQRLKALADEMGVDVSRIPAQALERLRQMNKEDFEKYADNAMREIKQKKQQVSELNVKDVEEIQRLSENIGMLEYRNTIEIPLEIERAEENIRVLEGEVDLGAEDDELKEEPIEPEAPLAIDFTDFNEEGDEVLDQNAYERAVQEFELELERYNRIVALNDQIRNDNEMRANLRYMNEVSKAELIAEQNRIIQELRDEEARNTAQITSLTNVRNGLTSRMGLRKRTFTVRLLSAMKTLTDAYAGRLQRTLGKGKSIDSRALAGLGRHYGADDSSSSESDSEEDSEEEDPLDYDDRRNDLYYSRPARR